MSEHITTEAAETVAANCDEVEAAMIRALVAERNSLREVIASPLRWHRCNGRTRPYSAILCSMCRSGEDVDFEAIKAFDAKAAEIERQQDEISALNTSHARHLAELARERNAAESALAAALKRAEELRKWVYAHECDVPGHKGTCRIDVLGIADPLADLKTASILEILAAAEAKPEEPKV